jgi:hypothetical protein
LVFGVIISAKNTPGDILLQGAILIELGTCHFIPLSPERIKAFAFITLRELELLKII